MPLSHKPAHAITLLQEEAIVQASRQHIPTWRAHYVGLSSFLMDWCITPFAWSYFERTGDHPVCSSHTILTCNHTFAWRCKHWGCYKNKYNHDALIKLVYYAIIGIGVDAFRMAIPWVVGWPPILSLSRYPSHAITPLHHDAIIEAASKHVQPWLAYKAGLRSFLMDWCRTRFTWSYFE